MRGCAPQIFPAAQLRWFEDVQGLPPSGGEAGEEDYEQALVLSEPSCADRATEDSDLLARQCVLGEQLRDRPGYVPTRTSRQPRRRAHGFRDRREQVIHCLDPTDHFLRQGNDNVRKHGFDLPVGCEARSQPGVRVRVNRGSRRPLRPCGSDIMDSRHSGVITNSPWTARLAGRGS